MEYFSAKYVLNSTAVSKLSGLSKKDHRAGGREEWLYSSISIHNTILTCVKNYDIFYLRKIEDDVWSKWCGIVEIYIRYFGYQMLFI